MALEQLFFWSLVFDYLEPEDLVSVASVCLTWWRSVFHGRKSTSEALRNCKDLDLADTGSMYLTVPLQYFTSLYRINLSRTSISSRNFLKLVSSVRQMRELNIEGCMGISENAIFEAKPLLRCLRSINISHNKQFNVRVIACLCSLDSLQEICARGIHLEFKELLFLSKTFPRLKDGQELVIDTADSDYLFDAVDIASDFELLEDLF